MDPFTVPFGDKVAFLQEMDAKLNQPGVLQRVGQLIFMRKQIIFLDSEGSQIEKTIIEAFPTIQVMGVDAQGVMHARSFSPSRLGATRGWETVDKPLFLENADRIVREMNQVVAAEPCPKDVRSVILLPGIMFLQTHETIGHALELDRILGYELGFAGGSFVRLEDFGKLRYGSPKLTARANATLPNSPGSFGYDDDGVPAQDNLLIDQGHPGGRHHRPPDGGRSQRPRPQADLRRQQRRQPRHRLLPGADRAHDQHQHRPRHGWHAG